MNRSYDRILRWLPAACLLLLLAAPLAAQQRMSTTVADPAFAASDTHELIFGPNWRAVWTKPVRVPVLDLQRTAGGLEPDRQGGRQSYTLHFNGKDGRRYVFRSVIKNLHKAALPPDVQRTLVGDIVQDQVSAMFPAPGLIAGVMFEEAGVLYSQSQLVQLPDDPRLGEFRETFAGMLGQFEENPNEEENDQPGFAGSSKIVDTDKWLERMDNTPLNRFAAEEYLTARLINFILGDTDRGSDQWKFARFPAGGDTLWRPIPRDTDFSFIRPTGWFAPVALRAYPKITQFDETFPSLRHLTIMTVDMDRRFLAGIPRDRWNDITRMLQQRLTDDVLTRAVDRMPPEYRPHAAAQLLAGLRARRDALAGIAGEYYAMVNNYAVVYATEEAERAEVQRNPDGSVDVRLFRVAPAVVQRHGGDNGNGGAAARNARQAVDAPYFTRRYVPAETKEIRLYMQGGDDRVVVSGNAQSSILVRVIGGAGADALTDSSRVASGGNATVLYAPDDGDSAAGGPDTRIDRKPYHEQPAGRPEDLRLAEIGQWEAKESGQTAHLVDRRLRGPSYGDWGEKFSIRPTVDYSGSVGIIVGGGPSYTKFGFRREPYAYRVSLDALYGIETNRFGLELYADYHPENSRMAFDLNAHASQLESFRFFGFGNESPRFDDNPRIRRDELLVHPAVYWTRPNMRFGFGPVLRYGKTMEEEDTPIDVLQPPGVGTFGQAGARVDAEYGRNARGTTGHSLGFDAGGSIYPALLDVADPFGELHAEARASIPLRSATGPFVSLRAGGQRVWGEFPVHDAAFLGGRRSLRGYQTDRFAGDASLYGSTELHAPLGEVELLVRGRLGVFGLVDAGRVYMDGASPGGWHTGVGGGVWFATLGRSVSLTYAHGETGRVYLELGLPLRR